MRRTRAILFVALLAVPVLVASEAFAQKVYSMHGRIISNRGEFIKIPVIGNTGGNCDNFRRGHDRITGATGGPNTTPLPPPMVPAGDFGCVEGYGMITATAAGTGKAFTIPGPMGTTTGPTAYLTGPFFDRPRPAMAFGVSIPNETIFPQLATDFRIQGPPKSIPMVGSDAPGGTQYPTLMYIAPFRRFHESAWQGGPAMSFMGQTGRGGPNFTWCFGNPDCVRIDEGTGALGRLMVKYTGGVNRFGGTMSYVITAPGLAAANLALRVGPPGGAINLLRLAGMGQQPTGRGYADYLSDMVMTGPAWAMYMVGMVYVPQIMQNQLLIVTVMTNLAPGPGTKTALTNQNYGFPWTTGTVLARATGLAPGAGKNPATSTLTGMGSDRVFTSGGLADGNRVLTLVAGQVARTTAGSNTPGMGFLPEPDRSAGLIAGALGLLAVAAWRSRRVR